MFPRPINHTIGDISRPVFITGAPRCGSSWVGEILGSCRNARYIYEPFNHRWMPSLRGQLRHFTYFNDSSVVPPVVQQTAENAFKGLQSWKQLTRAAYRGYWSAATHSASQVVIKDPTASLMSTWVARQFNAQVLFVMRHPCGFASSLEALNWNLNVNSLLRQDTLMQTHLERFRNVLNRARNDKWLTRGAVWASINFVYTKQMETNPNWLLFKYEDICNDPVGQFTLITQKLRLELSHNAHKKIQLLSTKESTDSGSTQRNSVAMPTIWKQRMSAGMIDAVMGITNEFKLGHY